MRRTTIAENIASGTTGWLNAVRVGSGGTDPITFGSISALAQGPNASFDIELWITTEEANGSPIGLWKLVPNFAASNTAEFPNEATEQYMFDVPVLWIHPRVVSLTGTLSVWGFV